MLLPPMFITYANRSTSIIAALVVMIICIVCAILIIPAMCEDKELIDRIFRISKERRRKEKIFLSNVEIQHSTENIYRE